LRSKQHRLLLNSKKAIFEIRRLTDILFKQCGHNLRLAVARFNMRSCSYKYSFSGNEPTLLGVTLRKA